MLIDKLVTRRLYGLNVGNETGLQTKVHSIGMRRGILSNLEEKGDKNNNIDERRDKLLVCVLRLGLWVDE